MTTIKIFMWVRSTTYHVNNQDFAIKWYEQISEFEDEIRDVLSRTVMNGYARNKHDKKHLIRHNERLCSIKFETSRILLFGDSSLGWVTYMFYPFKKTNGAYKKAKNNLINAWATISYTKIAELFDDPRKADLFEILPPSPPPLPSISIYSTVPLPNVSISINNSNPTYQGPYVFSTSPRLKLTEEDEEM